MTKFSTKRVVQLSIIADDLASRARVCFRGAANLERIGNRRGAQHQRALGARYHVIAVQASRLLERFA